MFNVLSVFVLHVPMALSCLLDFIFGLLLLIAGFGPSHFFLYPFPISKPNTFHELTLLYWKSGIGMKKGEGSRTSVFGLEVLEMFFNIVNFFHQALPKVNVKICRHFHFCFSILAAQ